MKQCIVYYSKTGNTKSVAERFNGFDLLTIKAESDDPNNLKPVLKDIPKISDYDYIVLATPVHGFQMSQIMKAYLTQVDSFKDKTIDLFITHFFPFAWMGGNITLKQMKKIIEQKGGVIRQMTSINWKNKKRESSIVKMIHEYHA